MPIPALVRVAKVLGLRQKKPEHVSRRLAKAMPELRRLQKLLIAGGEKPDARILIDFRDALNHVCTRLCHSANILRRKVLTKTQLVCCRC
jgi:hypothetical protein